MNEREEYSEREFLPLVQEALPSLLGARSLELEPRLAKSARPDFVAQLDSGREAIVEVRVVTPATSVRLDKVAAQLRHYGEAYTHATGKAKPDLVLVLSGSLPPERTAHLRRAGITTVIDGPMLRAAAPHLPWPDAVAKVYGAPGPTAEASAGSSLVGELLVVAPGRAEWAKYQRVVRDILAATLSPPLGLPLDERTNLSGVNRRDIIFPNYATEGLWEFLRHHYDAHYVVVDAKNYVGGVKKKDILQVANYLSAHGAGLFGMIVCRNAADRSAEVTRREQWVIYRKLILILNDEDLRTMLALTDQGEDPAIVIRQKIEDFRLGF
jgi:hypothetical protein